MTYEAPQSLAPGQATPLQASLGWLTDARLVNGQPTTFTAQAQYLKDGTWIDVSGSNATISFTLQPRPVMSDRMLVKRPRSTDDPLHGEIYFQQNGIKWHLASEAVADSLFPEWRTAFYVYPAAAVASLRSAAATPWDATVPELLGRNVLLKEEGQSVVYLLEPAYGQAGPLLLKPFHNETTFYACGFPAGSLDTDVVAIGHNWDWIVATYPICCEITSVDSRDGELPSTPQLHGNWPNPFNPKTAILYSVPAESEVRLIIYDLQGRAVSILDEGQRQAGFHVARWDGTDMMGRPVGSGVYITRMYAGDYVRTTRMMLV